MSSSKKDHDHQQGAGVAKGKPSSMKAAAVSEEKTPRSPQKVEKPFHREGSGRGRAEGGQQGKKKPTTKEERRAIQVSVLCNLTTRLSHMREWNKIKATPNGTIVSHPPPALSGVYHTI